MRSKHVAGVFFVSMLQSCVESCSPTADSRQPTADSRQPTADSPARTGPTGQLPGSEDESSTVAGTLRFNASLVGGDLRVVWREPPAEMREVFLRSSVHRDHDGSAAYLRGSADSYVGPVESLSCGGGGRSCQEVLVINSGYACPSGAEECGKVRVELGFRVIGPARVGASARPEWQLVGIDATPDGVKTTVVSLSIWEALVHHD